MSGYSVSKGSTESSFSYINRPQPQGNDKTTSYTSTDEGIGPLDVNFTNFDDDYTNRGGHNILIEAATDDDRERGKENSYYDDEEEEEVRSEEEDVVGELPTLDQINTVKPVVDYQDRLWKQIDILDDVKKMSADIVQNGTFFNSKHSSLLQDLRESQLKLLNHIKKLEKLVDESIYHEIWDLNLDDTVEDEIELVKAKLLNRDQFIRIDASITEIKNGMDVLKQNIKSVDENTKDMWENNDFSGVAE